MYLFHLPLYSRPSICLAYSSCLLSVYKNNEWIFVLNICSVCLLLGLSDYLNIEVLPSLGKLTVIVLVYISLIIIKYLHKLSFINPHNNPVG